MSAMHDRPTLEERYSAAMDAKDLSMHADERRPVDLLVAAGWCRSDDLGTLLYRLLREFDRRRAEVHRIDKDASDRRADMLSKARRERKGTNQHAIGVAQDALRSELAAASSDALIARAVLLAQLRSLVAARAALGRYAAVIATRTRCMLDETAVMQIAGRALEGWLDPLCPICDGRGFLGGYRTPQIGCTTCNGTRRRDVHLADSSEGQNFGRLLQLHLDRKTSRVHELMTRFMDQRGETPKTTEFLATVMAHAKVRLGELNSAAALKD